MHGVSRPELTRQKCLSRSPKEGKQKQHAEQRVDSGEHQIRRMNALLEIEDEQGSSVGELFDDGRNHHQAKAHRIERDYQERKLPRQPCADEAVIEAGMGNGRRILPPDQIEHKIKRREDQHAPDEGNPENDLGEFHCSTSEWQNLVLTSSDLYSTIFSSRLAKIFHRRDLRHSDWRPAPQNLD